MLQFWDAANALSLAALAAAVGSALWAVNGHLAYAVVALMASGLCDLFDGFVARRLSRDDRQKTFGGRLDSLVDACSFGFAPVVLLYCSGLRGLLGIVLLILFSASAVWRLAYFDTVGLQEEVGGRYYVGLPTTYVALVFPLAYLAGLWWIEWLTAVLAATTVVVSAGMLAPLSIRKPRGAVYGFFLVLAAALTVIFITYSGRLAAPRDAGERPRAHSQSR